MKKSIKYLVESIILTLWAVFFAHWLSGITGIEALASRGAWGWIALFVYYLIFVYLGLRATDFLK
jgi:hypothetical protein